jgi:hypothetical protein
MRHGHKMLYCGILGTLLCGVPASALFAEETADLLKQLQELREQNRTLQNQLQQQQQLIDDLSRKFSGLERTNQQDESDLRSLKATLEGATPPAPEGNHTVSLGNVIISGEGGAGFFDTQENGRYPNAPFRVDEARLFLDAPVWDDVFFYTEVDLMTAESQGPELNLAELYLQFESLAKHWGQDQLLNARIGQFYIPFGEEYQYRFAIDDPLVSHSLSDLWGVDPGIELYGSWNKLSYAVAVQNGGISTLNDNTADKSVAGRIGYDPFPWLHLSASGMRTGDLSATKDVSALWFGGGFFQSIGSSNTSLYHVNLAEVDAAAKWKGGYVKGAAGYAGYGDNDPTPGGSSAASSGYYYGPAPTSTGGGNNHRDIYYYYVEALQHVTPKFYGVSRLSQIRAAGGYPILADSPSLLPTSDIWRLSLGLGYQFNNHLVLKTEYMFEQGQLARGGPRHHENMFATEAAFKF